MADLKRDSQRKKVHESVRAADDLVGKPLADMRAVDQFVAKIQGRATLKRRYGVSLEDIRVGDGRGSSWTHGDKRGIVVPTRQRTTIYVLRAMAHTIVARHRRSAYIGSGERHSELRDFHAAWHGWQYCAILMDLVRYGLGETEANVLKAEFEKRNVRWTKPHKKFLTIEQKEKAKKRGRELAAMNKDRKRRLEYIQLNPEAVLKNADEFEEEYWETLYRIWR